MRVGIFGGTFNPPHIGHLIVAEFIREEANLDKIIFIPCASPPHKQSPEYLSQMASSQHRFEMVKIAIKGNPFFEVSDIEIKRGGISYTVETVSYLVEKFPKYDFYLLIGADQFEEFHTWRDPDEIVKKVHLLVFNRYGYVIPESKFSPFAKFITIPNIDISASAIRERVRAGKSIRYLVPSEVEEYIYANGLYK
ncbi:nicotinate-nucleotide adenylyltransferase [Candidatus Kryptonium thompsonii]|jgi:nicotinate-nucleotide adenylyltransferase|uniref:Probable nicotinate-nucleotide adenylyltransferase n=1 Tax=Candidatus Kryptonium thompsonii TaxID=1633631 RepID=A0A0P1P8Y5_9BACT|nr:nicotinate (nicotinamide) nucleotide adenylyltransferase [Candidatus Kryptonium thompsoni]CUS78778.1 nicotinate-nucleotide adenylyltransferase [Candidatus Kryptonium thompsoni]CUS83041.1 nicotinate-nucleotide adenylyltransferase [Candidatus Kryptonium thompsoni]CUS94260.1 nicotinate-nucleotide adenylyltransferase [Candidatus Kryptonium thompsoni]CUS98865.1 nicotinate-nucleotide adenylyltransferase [Candidatus Kryptonium thompsoni]CUT01713.1 nicotinate-nucleotide adenylyltransferase [Candida